MKSILADDYFKLERLGLRKQTMMDGTFMYCSPAGSEYLFTYNVGTVATPIDIDQFPTPKYTTEPAEPVATGKKCPTEDVAEIVSYSTDGEAFQTIGEKYAAEQMRIIYQGTGVFFGLFIAGLLIILIILVIWNFSLRTIREWREQRNEKNIMKHVESHSKEDMGNLIVTEEANSFRHTDKTIRENLQLNITTEDMDQDLIKLTEWKK